MSDGLHRVIIIGREILLPTEKIFRALSHKTFTSEISLVLDEYHSIVNNRKKVAF